MLVQQIVSTAGRVLDRRQLEIDVKRLKLKDFDGKPHTLGR